MKTEKTKKFLVVLIGMLLGGVVFSVIQFIEASPGAPNPGHEASEIGSGIFSGSASDVWSFPGNVGIGAVSPGYKLDVVGQVNASGLCLDYDCISSWSSVTDASNVSADTNGIGWRRVAHIDATGGRGQNTVTVYTTGGNYAPRSTSIRWFHDWSDKAGLSVIAEYGSSYWTDARVTDDGTNSYLEVYFVNDVSTLKLTLQNDGGYYRGSLYSGVLPSGGGSIRASTKLGLFVIGSGKFYIAYDGNVGIGDTTPDYKLDVAGDINADNQLCIAGVCKGSWPSGEDDLGDHTATEDLNLNSNSITGVQNIMSAGDRVAPHIVLDSIGSGDIWTSQGAYISLGENGDLGAAALHLTYRGDGYGWIGSGAVSNGVPGASYLRFDYNSNNIYTPDILTVGGLVNASEGTINVNDGWLDNVRALRGKDWDDNTGGADNKYRLLYRDGAHMFYNGGVVVGNYDNGTWADDLADGTLIVEGNVGIGDTTPDYKLDVAGDINADNQLCIAGVCKGSWPSGGDDLGDHTATQNIKLNGRWLSGDGGNEGVYVTSDGNVGIGITDPTGALQVMGDEVRIGGGTPSIATSPGDLFVSDSLEFGGELVYGDIDHGAYPVDITCGGEAAACVRIQNTYTPSVSSDGIRVYSQDGTAILGYSYGDSGGKRAVYGYAAGSTGKAVYGYAKLADGYDFYAAGPGTNYGPFTGAHEVILAEGFPEETKSGMIVSVTGETKIRIDEQGRPSISSTLPTVALSGKEKDASVLGAFIAVSPLSEDHWYADESEEEQQFGIVNALGEGRVWVSNVNGNIQVGDYITTSNIAGYGQKQEDDLLHSYTLGKAIESVDWGKVTDTVKHNGNTYKVYLIAVIYVSG